MKDLLLLDDIDLLNSVAMMIGFEKMLDEKQAKALENNFLILIDCINKSQSKDAENVINFGIL